MRGLSRLNPTLIVNVIRTPSIKFASNMIFSLLYIVYYQECLTGFLYPLFGVELLPSAWGFDHEWMHQNGNLDACRITVKEVFLWCWTGGRLVEELKQFLHVGSDALEETDRWSAFFTVYFSSSTNLLDVFNVLTVLAVMVLRVWRYNSCEACRTPQDCTSMINMTEDYQFDGDILTLCRCLYAIATITISIRFMSLMKVQQGFGVLYLSTYSMLLELREWIKVCPDRTARPTHVQRRLTVVLPLPHSDPSQLVIFITIPTGFALTILMPSQNFASHTFVRPMLRPVWGLVGDVQVEEAADYFPEPNPRKVVTINLLPQFFVGALSFVYLFATTIVLVNLLVALMQQRYDEVTAEGRQAWLSERPFLIKEFKDDRDMLPPPLNVIFLVFYQFPRVLVRCFRYRGSLKESFEFRTESSRFHRGFKLLLGAGATEHTRQVARRLRQGYLKKEEEERDKDSDAHFRKLHERQSMLLANVEMLNGHVARMCDKLSLGGHTHREQRLSSLVPISPPASPPYAPHAGPLGGAEPEDRMGRLEAKLDQLLRAVDSR